MKTQLFRKNSMNKALLAMLLTATVSVHAEPISITFTYEGADYYSTYMFDPEWMPSATLVAGFTGEDLNGDNVITANELTSLYAQGINYLAPDGPIDGYQVNFSYRNPHDYSINVSHYRYYDPANGLSGWQSHQFASWSPTAQSWGWENDLYRYEKWTGTSDTIATVVSSVPEPMTIAMLGIGLSIIGLSRQRSKGATR